MKDYDDGLNDGYEILEDKIKKLLARREDLKFDWRKDLNKLLDEAFYDLSSLENRIKE